MNLITIKNQNDLEVVTGVGRRLINAVATNRVMKVEIEKNEHFKKVRTLSQELYALTLKGRNDAKINELKELIKSENALLNIDMLEVYKEKVIYFELKPDERSITKEEAHDFRTLLAIAKVDKKAILSDKTAVVNLVGQSYYLKNAGLITKHVITDLGFDLPAGAIEKLTVEDEEAFAEKEAQEEIEGMSPAEKNAKYKEERKKVIEKVLSKTVDLQLDGESLQDARDQAMLKAIQRINILKARYSQS